MRTRQRFKFASALVTATVALTVSLTACETESPTSPASGGGRKSCEPSYPSICIPPKSEVGDLDCADISARRFRVAGLDPHGFDRDRDGIGCES